MWHTCDALNLNITACTDAQCTCNTYAVLWLTTPVAFAICEYYLFYHSLPRVHEVQDLLRRQLCCAKAFTEFVISWPSVTPDDGGVYSSDKLMAKICMPTGCLAARVCLPIVEACCCDSVIWMRHIVLGSWHDRYCIHVDSSAHPYVFQVRDGAGLLWLPD